MKAISYVNIYIVYINTFTFVCCHNNNSKADDTSSERKTYKLKFLIRRFFITY